MPDSIQPTSVSENVLFLPASPVYVKNIFVLFFSAVIEWPRCETKLTSVDFPSFQVKWGHKTRRVSSRAVVKLTSHHARAVTEMSCRDKRPSAFGGCWVCITVVAKGASRGGHVVSPRARRGNKQSSSRVASAFQHQGVGLSGPRAGEGDFRERGTTKRSLEGRGDHTCKPRDLRVQVRPGTHTGYERSDAGQGLWERFRDDA